MKRLFDYTWQAAIKGVKLAATSHKHKKIGHTPSLPPPHVGRGRSQEIFGKKNMDDNINQPEHYKQHDLEVIEAIKGLMSADEYHGYLRGAIIKYLGRYRYKGKPVEDLRKARWYLEKLIEEIIEDGRPYKD